MTKLKNIKPSELPTFSVIEDLTYSGEGERLFMRDSLGGWSLVFPKDMHEADLFEIRPIDADSYFTDFAVRSVPYGWTRGKRSSLNWKDIPGFPHWQISENGVVRDVRFHGYKRRTKKGHFNLYVNGRKIPWSESELGNEEERLAFFAGNDK